MMNYGNNIFSESTPLQYAVSGEWFSEQENACGLQWLIGKQMWVNTNFVSPSAGMRAKRAYSKMKIKAKHCGYWFSFCVCPADGLRKL
jgi:hypothetical protein